MLKRKKIVLYVMGVYHTSVFMREFFYSLILLKMTFTKVLEVRKYLFLGLGYIKQMALLGYIAQNPNFFSNID